MLKVYVAAKTKIAEFTDRFSHDESGASLIEYSILIGLITVAAIAAIVLVGSWVSAQWTSLEAAL